MLKKIIIFCFFFLILYLYFFPNSKKILAQAQSSPPPIIQVVPTIPTPCQGSSGCPADVEPSLNYQCASSYEEWQRNKTLNFWVDDEEVTLLGKQGERARQFTYWILSRKSIDIAPNLIQAWNQSRNVALGLLIIVFAVFGLGYIFQKRFFGGESFDIKGKVFQIGGILAFIFLSFYIPLSIIQFADLISNFFIETLAVEKIFNIFFLPINQTGSLIQKSEMAYLQFQGCRNLNVNLVESIKTSLFLIKITNILYFILGIMLVLRKIVLWCLLAVAPFLGLLLAFRLIRNIGFIWVGVFFQWVFYGPILSLFLGVVATIWNNPPYIPFNFDFSRINTPQGFIYQTGINILYGGPAQTLSFSNTSNYVDTFAEYVISLIMLVVAIFFPWWLLRIFRDYCCDGIYAAKNILLEIYDQLRIGPSPSSHPSPFFPTFSTTVSSAKITQDTKYINTEKFESLEEIKKAQTEEIVRSLNLSVKKLTEVAHVETNKQLRENIRKNINYLQNPLLASSPKEKLMFMNIKNEVFSRSIKQDKIAQTLISSTSASALEQQKIKEKIIKNLPQPQPISKIISTQMQKVSPIKLNQVTISIFQVGQKYPQVITKISQKTNTPANQVSNVINFLSDNIAQTPITSIIKKTSQTNQIEEKVVKTVVKEYINKIKSDPQILEDLAVKNEVAPEQIKHLLENQLIVVTEPDENIEKTITIPQTVSIEEYEEVKKMWKNHYLKGEVPVTENLNTREEWINQEIVFLTNTLNKLLSEDEKLKQQGVDDLGFLLPIFLINNLSSDQLLVYLKAKLEAAKEVLEEKRKEEELLDKLRKKQEEELVTVSSKKPKEEGIALEQELSQTHQKDSKLEKNE